MFTSSALGMIIFLYNFLFLFRHSSSLFCPVSPTIIIGRLEKIKIGQYDAISIFGSNCFTLHYDILEINELKAE